MRFRPCIDIHNGKVKQIVGDTISDLGKADGQPKENFVADKDAAYYANIYKADDLRGGIIENKHGGTMSFESVEGEGATFTFTLPIRK